MSKFLLVVMVSLWFSLYAVWFFPNIACANDTYADPYDTYIKDDEDTVIRIDKFTGNTRMYTTDGHEDPDVLIPLDGGDILIIPGDLYIDE